MDYGKEKNLNLKYFIGRINDKRNKYILLSFDVESDIGSWTQNYASVDKAINLILNILIKKRIPATFFIQDVQL